MKSRKDMAHDEATRNPIFLYELKRRHGWETDRVFYSRREAQVFGENNQHNVRGCDGVGWRVYCVCAEGVLVDALNAYDKQMVSS